MHGGQYYGGQLGPSWDDDGRNGDGHPYAEVDGYAEAYDYYDFPQLTGGGQRSGGRRWLGGILVAVLVVAVVFLGYTRVYLPRHNHSTAAMAAGPGFVNPASDTPAASGSATPSSTTPPTLAWKPWLAGDGGKALRGMELGDTTLVDARQKAQAALKSGKGVPAAGTALAKAAAAELQAVATARTAPLPQTKAAQAAWAKAMTDLTQGSGQLATAAKAMQGNNKASATSAIAASMPSMNAAFDDLNTVQEGIPAP